MSSPSAAPAPETRARLNWVFVAWSALIHVGIVLAPFTFTWSGLAICLGLYVLTGIGITMGYHRLLTHRSFQTSRPVEYSLTLLGCLANQGGPLDWVATHRKHHARSDDEGDPHSPRDGGWWAHMFWWMWSNPEFDIATRRRYVKDLERDPFHRFLERFQILLPFALGALLFGLGQLWGGVGLSWVVWGIFVRTTLVYHITWLVNSATHMWGYRTYPTGDRSRNLWWVALLSFGEGWHNNHHAFQRSARHGLRWWEVDFTYYLIEFFRMIGLAWGVQTPRRGKKSAQEAKGKLAAQPVPEGSSGAVNSSPCPGSAG